MLFRALTALLLLVVAAPVQALRFYVNPDSARGDDRRSVQSAQNPDTPVRTIGQALRLAHLIPEGRPHVVQLTAGTYAPRTNGEKFPLLVTQAGIYLETSGLTVFDAEGKSNFLEITGPTSDFLLKGIDFTRGSAARGGAVYCKSCSLRVVNSRFFNNRASEAGQVIYVEDGRLKFFNNVLRDNGHSGSEIPVLEMRSTNADTTARHSIRNNTFYRNPSPNISTSSPRTDISSNIFLDPEKAAIRDASTTSNPLVRYNLFWETEILYISDRSDSIKVQRTIRDTLTLAQQGVVVPAFVTNVPDTVAKVGSLYRYDIQVKGNKTAYDFNPLTLPQGISAQQVDQQGLINWTPALADTGAREVRVEIIDPSGVVGFLHYNIKVFTQANFPDTTSKGPRITITFKPDTTGAVADLNALVPAYSSAASAAGNKYGNPAFLDTVINRFELKAGSPALDAGTPVVALRDAPGRRVTVGDGDRNNMGDSGGPVNSGAPPPDTTFSELRITTLPDSLAIEGRPFVYDPVLAPTAKIELIDLIPGFKAPSMDPFRTFGKRPPITWTPTLADTGTYLIGVQIYTASGFGRHYFPLRVRPANQTPRVTSAPDTLLQEKSAFTYAVKAVDADGDTLRFSLQSGPQGMQIDALGVVRWTPAQKDVGRVPVEVRVEDGKGGALVHSFFLRVLNVNDPPVITSAPDSAAVEDRPYTYAVKAADPDPADSLSFSLPTAPAGMKIDSLGTVRWTPTQAQVGANQVTVRVADRQGGSAEQRFTLRVAEVDDPPLISSTPDTLAREDSLYTYVVKATDEEGGRLSYALVTAPAGMQIDSLGTVRWTPAAADTGRRQIALRATDPGGQSAEQRFTLRVLAVDDPPRIVSRTPASAEVSVQPGAALTLSIAAQDEEGAALSFAWRLNGIIQPAATGTSFTYTPATSSVDSVTVEVSDGHSTTSATWRVDGRRIPRLSVATDTVRFGDVAIGDTARVRLNVANRGSAALTISSLQVGDLRFAAAFGASGLAPGDSTVLTLSFFPSARSVHSSLISFSSNDPERPSTSIPVRGRGLVPTHLSLDLDPAAFDQRQTERSIEPGAEFTLAIYGERALDLLNFEARLAYDAARLRFVRFAARSLLETNLLDREGVTLLIAATTLSDTLVQVTVTSATQGAEGVRGDGLLGLVTFAADSSLAPERPARIRLQRALVHSRGQQTADTLRPALEVLVRGKPRLPGDFDGSGVVDFTDFFLFADHFGTTPTAGNWDPAFDLDADADVDFEDFFSFADHFGRRAAKWLSAAAPPAAAALRLEALAQGPDLVEIGLRWQGGEAPRGYALELEFDARELDFETFRPRPAEPPLAWVARREEGRLLLAAGLSRRQGDFREDDLGTLVFTRRGTSEARLRPLAVLAYRNGIVPLSAPPTLVLEALPRDFALFTPYPNPFNPETSLPFYLPRAAAVHLRLYDLLGQPVRTLHSGPLQAGYHRLLWDGTDTDGRPAAAGVYLAELRVADFRQVRKLMLLK